MVGGLALIHYNPLLTLALLVIFIVAFIYFAPKIFRAMKGKIWLTFKKLNGPAIFGGGAQLSQKLPSRYAATFDRENVLKETVAWAAPCLSGRADESQPIFSERWSPRRSNHAISHSLGEKVAGRSLRPSNWITAPSLTNRDFCLRISSFPPATAKMRNTLFSSRGPRRI